MDRAGQLLTRQQNVGKFDVVLTETVGIRVWQPDKHQRLKAAHPQEAAFFMPSACQFNGGPGGEAARPAGFSSAGAPVCQPRFGLPPSLGRERGSSSTDCTTEAVMADSLPQTYLRRVPAHRSAFPTPPADHVAERDKHHIRFPVIGRGRYGVDSDGNAYSLINGSLRLLKPAYPQGYALIFLCFAGERKRRVRVHRLVATAFLPKSAGRDHVNHKNGDKSDNRACNLEWVTPSENSRHALRTGLYWPVSCVTSEQKEKAISMRASGKRLREIASELGCSITTAHKITAGAR